MSDIDDELLALAGGGDVSSDEEDAASMDMSREESQSPPPVKKKEAPAKGVATKKVAAKKTKKRRQEDSEEEGEASSAPSSPNSLDSAPMDESDSDSDSPQSKSRDDEGSKYPVEGLFMSHAEKAEIMAMREFEREQILAERKEEKERMRQNALLRQLVTNQENEEKKHKKRKASAADLEDGQRKTSRVRKETSSALDTLKRARAEKSERMRRRDERKERSPSFRIDDADASGDSDVEWAGPSKHKSRSPEIKEVPLADFRDVERVRVGRSRFAEVCFFPGFDETITDCYVRINVGPDPDTRENVYRMAVIKGFNTGRPYAMEDLRGKQFVTDQYVKAAHGKAVRDWPFIACSDRPFTETEWNRYQKTCQAENVPLPKKPALANKIDDINRLVKRTWTEEELQVKLDRQQKLKARFSGVERERLEKAIEKAKNQGNDQRANELQDELDKLETPRLAFRTSLAPAGTKSASTPNTPSQQERLAELNRQNRKRNQEAVRRAQILEKKKARDLEARIERGEAVEEDTSRRLKTKAKFIHDVNEKIERKAGADSQNASGTSTPANGGTPRLGAQKPQPLLPHLAKLQAQNATKNGIPTIHKPLMDDDIIGALDLDIDVEID
ncbi:putative rna polymerase 2 transcription elongation factor protein [Phaeoacremonium minimum UCRPA7]|uniref:Putative rna polymerase 2 transcription elongation factor protein n=1 Tax=Phaeoacremonium minimum (strain UCR-PA7) TaxID=1286976 RepID=R8BVU4_PHAM7|nr:putative rna polymerase 2 transcription elongation factor protein [Phaeoacremonium minimum UCRPA7]EOO03478.1 putative rna polymerase 2 transcription elongation factor protein [Phaeoacremonium minimum UCRPA7]